MEKIGYNRGGFGENGANFSQIEEIFIKIWNKSGNRGNFGEMKQNSVNNGERENIGYLIFKYK